MKSFLSASLIACTILSSSAFALKIDDAKACPSLAAVSTQTTFDTAINVMDNIWGLFNAAGFEHQNKNWHAFFVTVMEESDSVQALKDGQKFFNDNVTLSNPEVMQEMCVYAMGDQYAFIAVDDESNYKVKNLHLK